MKCTVISDTHNLLNEIVVPKSDLLIHCGDLTSRGTMSEFQKELNILGEITKRFKYGCVAVHGNHDFVAERQNTLIKEMGEKLNIHFLNSEAIEVNGYKFYGSPYTPRFGRWAFMKDHGYSMYYEWEKIPEDTEILITHGPPWGILDETGYGDHVGCEELRSKLKDLNKLKLSCYGHIHEQYGIVQIGNIKFINASICTLDYKPFNAPIVTMI